VICVLDGPVEHDEPRNRMYRPLTLSLSLALLSSWACATKSADVSSSEPAASAPGPQISLETARSTALGRVPGKVLEEELEREDGRMVYSFEIQPDEPGRGGR
jgi:hypothetical protein